MANNPLPPVKPPHGRLTEPPPTGPREPPIRRFAAIGIGVFNVAALLFLVWSGHIPAVRKLNPSELVAEASEALGLTGISQFVKPKAAPWTSWREMLQKVEFVDHARDVGRAASLHAYILLPSQNAGYRNGKWLDAMLSAKAPTPAKGAPAKEATNKSVLFAASQMLFYLPTTNRTQTLATLWRQSTEPQFAALAAMKGEGAGATDSNNENSDDSNSDQTVADSGNGGLIALVQQSYNHDLARTWLSDACERGGKDCPSTGFSGPYVMMTARAMGNIGKVEGDDFLLIDLTPIREQGFSAVVAGLHEAAAAAPGQGLAEVQARLSAFDLPSSAWITLYSGNLGQLTHLVATEQIQ